MTERAKDGFVAIIMVIGACFLASCGYVFLACFASSVFGYLVGANTRPEQREDIRRQLQNPPRSSLQEWEERNSRRL